MLVSLFVKDFAIVGEADIGFQPGMTVVTGETGAGKSLIVDALLLLAGNRADAGVVRHGCERAELMAEFRLDDVPAARDWLVAEEFDEDNGCQLRRVIRSEGTSRAWINGRPATLTQLKALGERLIEIHGQHEHQALLDRGSQLALLDAFGNHAAALERVSVSAHQWRDIDARMRALKTGEDPSERIAFLEHQLDELDRHALSAAQLATLDEDHRRLSNAGQLVQGSNGVADLLDGDSEFVVLRLLSRAQNEIARLSELDHRLVPARELFDSATIGLNEANDLIARYRDNLDLDPDRLGDIETQIAKLHELSRKHRVATAELKPFADTLRVEVETLRGAGASLAVLERQRKALELEYCGNAAKLTASRTATAARLSKEVTRLMSELGMPGGSFVVHLEKVEKGAPDPQGLERSEFLVSANPGQPPRALRKVASGGELSRISLAIEVAALGHDEIGTMVFDEVDSGIGGAVAEVVGQKLRRLGDKRQVLCVTHLAQVAVQGHQHLSVAKSSDGKNTATRIEVLDEKSRRNEIARMLGGVDIKRETLAHAKQMLESAQTD